MKRIFLLKPVLSVFFFLSSQLLWSQLIIVEAGPVLNSERKAQQEVRLEAPNGVATSTGVLQSRLYIDKTIMVDNNYSSLPNTTGSIRDHDKNLPVGTIEGKAFVDMDGSSNYIIDVEIPPGTNNMVPKIAITYNQNAGDAHLGLGWSIGGISSIKKNNFTRFQDEWTREYSDFNVLWYNQPGTSTIPLYLDGVKLVPIADQNSVNQFLLQDDKRSRVTYNSTDDYFLVETYPSIVSHIVISES